MKIQRTAFFFQRKAYIFGLLAALFLAGCGLVPGDQQYAANADGTPVPTPTRDPSGYQAISAQACPVLDWPAMQTDKPQGDLIAFQPGQNNLAYMAPSERSSWYTGTLMLAKGPDFKQRVSPAPSTLAAGDLTWSPSGDMLAFLGFRPNEGVYTVMVVRADGSGLVDLFPGDSAHTDTRTSQKAIIGWKGEQTLQVMASCGEECRQSYSVGVSAATGLALTPTPVENYRDLLSNLQLHVHAVTPTSPAVKSGPTPTPEQFPRMMRSPVWSPDDQLVAFLDKKGFPWLLSRPTKIMYPLDIGLRDVAEMRWSDDARSLAVRAEDRIFEFEVPCRHAQ